MNKHPFPRKFTWYNKRTKRQAYEDHVSRVQGTNMPWY